MASIKRSFSLCILLVVLGVFASFRYYFLMLYLDGGWRILHTVLQHVEIDRQRKIRFNISLTGCGALFIYSGPHLVPLQYSTVQYSSKPLSGFLHACLCFAVYGCRVPIQV